MILSIHHHYRYPSDSIQPSDLALNYGIRYPIGPESDLFRRTPIGSDQVFIRFRIGIHRKGSDRNQSETTQGSPHIDKDTAIGKSRKTQNSTA